MISRRTLLAALALLGPAALAADPPAAGSPLPRMFLAHARPGDTKAAAALGQHGAWVVTSQARWDQALAALKAHDVEVSDFLRGVDFDKENLACAFHFGDEGDALGARRVAADPDKRAVDVQIGLAYVIYKQRRALPPGVWKLAAIPVPKADVTRLSVWSFHPQNGGPYPTIDQARLDWEWTFSKDAGEAVGFLTAAIAPAAATVKPGEDIRLSFTLSFAAPGKPDADQFAPAPPKAVHVWDGKYSNGHRNHAFEVVTPDGKTLLLRPAEREWSKNIPHPVAVAPGQPYVLPNWFEGQTLKSLKELGLDTARPGPYTITGIYQETGAPQGKDPEMWGGILRTNTVTVDVK